VAAANLQRSLDKIVANDPVAFFFRWARHPLFDGGLDALAIIFRYSIGETIKMFLHITQTYYSLQLILRLSLYLAAKHHTFLEQS
jgi:hypothetical protein